MTSNVPPAIRHEKLYDRGVLVCDLEYFCTEAIRRAEQLARIDKSWRKPIWQQTAALLRRVRGEARREADDERRRAKLGRVA